MPIDIDTKLELVQLFYRNGDSLSNCMRAFKKKHNLRNDPFTLTAIKRVIEHFETTKSLHKSHSPGRNSLIDDRITVVTNSLEAMQHDNPLSHASSSAVSQQTGIPKTSVLRVLKGIGMSPYKISLAQELLPADQPIRVQFANWAKTNEYLMKDVLWSDESYFSLDGMVNRHNCVIWAYNNPHAILTKGLHSPKLCVWVGFTASYALEPFFYDTTVNQHNYAAMLINHVITQLRRRRKMRTVIFQHDGAPPHYALSVRDVLAQHFGENRVIGRGYGHPWPPRSPDLTPVDFYFWGTLKARVYHHFIPSDLNELKAKIRQEICAFSVAELGRSVLNLQRRCDLIIQENGGHIQHLL